MSEAAVLLVDDDFDLRETLADILSDEGYAVAGAADGLEALEWLRANPAPRLVLLDMMMPRCDGAEFRERQRQDPTIAGIPVVLLTADPRVAQRLRHPVDGHLVKPVAIGDLLATVRRYCGEPNGNKPED